MRKGGGKVRKGRVELVVFSAAEHELMLTFDNGRDLRLMIAP